MSNPLLSRIPRIITTATDILDVEIGVIVHGCNAQGVMRSGLAAQIKERYPEVYKAYVDQRPLIRKSGPRGGGALYGTIPMGSVSSVEVNTNKWVVNAITQLNFGKDGRRYVSYDSVDLAFRHVVRLIYEIRSVRGFMPNLHIPRIGAGLGGGDLRAILEIILSVVPDEIPVILHNPPWHGRRENGGEH